MDRTSYSLAMPTCKQVVEIKDRPWNRAVKVTITALAIEGIDVQDLAQKAWRASTKKITDGAVAVKVEAFGRG
jgi:hypothetical protein